ncbi:MAG: MBL fold metallo-hydrolase [Thermoanaerobaculia bacterium]
MTTKVEDSTTMMIRMLVPAVFLFFASLASAAGIEQIVPGMWLARGAYVQGQQPDGNSVIIRAAEGFVIVDTGRHREHTQSLLDFAAKDDEKIAAVVNTHWHLDHTGGNALVRAANPTVRIFATPAIEEAMTGFLANYRKQLEGAIENSADKPEQVERWRTEIALIDAGSRLAPDTKVTESGNVKIAGRTFNLNVETHAVTAGDIWILDRPTRVLIAGDLVTYPAPFLDTACPARWKAALDRISRVQFRYLVPGHGPVIDPLTFEHYRSAFGHLLDCGASEKEPSACAERWLRDVGDLVPESDHAFTTQMIEYYVTNHLRGDAGRNAKLCGE